MVKNRLSDWLRTGEWNSPLAAFASPENNDQMEAESSASKRSGDEDLDEKAGKRRKARPKVSCM